MKSPGFDAIAFAYDLLARIVFGKSIRESQFFYLDRIPAGARVLIVGGGTGWLAKRLLQINSSCTIVYQEASEEMLSRSRKRMSGDDLKRIHFVHSSAILSNETFDAVITNFFLDLFSISKMEDVVMNIKSSLGQNGLWIITDFVDDGKWWQDFLLKSMYVFFRIASGIEASSLPPWDYAVQKHGMITVESKDFYGGFIKTQITKCNPHVSSR